MKKIIALFLALSVLLGSWPSYAGYAQLKPPPGWSQGMGAAVPGTAGSFNFGAAANGSVYKGTTVLTNAALAVAGQVVTVPVSLRVAANAGSFAASFAFGNPALFALLAAGSAAYQWFDGSKFQVQNGAWVKLVGGGPAHTQYTWDNQIWSTSKTAGIPAVTARLTNYYTSYNFSSPECSPYGDNLTCLWRATLKTTGAPAGDFRNGSSSRAVPASDPVFAPVGDPEFQSVMSPKPLPPGLPQLLPIPLPVEPPVFNPDPAYDPALAPAPRPLWVPTGDPVKNPNPSNNPDGSPGPNPTPDTWTQPGVKVQPSPTPSDPWRVDVTPEPITKTNPSPNTSPETVTPGSPEPLDILTCGLPGKPRCLIDETGTKPDAGTTLDPAKTALDTVKTDAKTAIDSAQTIAAPAWTFSFQLPTGCAPYQTGLRGVLLNICQYQSTIHDLMSMIWAGATFFCLVGMVGRTIRES